MVTPLDALLLGVVHHRLARGEDALESRVARRVGQVADHVHLDLFGRIEAERGEVADVQLDDLVPLVLHPLGAHQHRAADVSRPRRALADLRIGRGAAAAPASGLITGRGMPPRARGSSPLSCQSFLEVETRMGFSRTPKVDILARSRTAAICPGIAGNRRRAPRRDQERTMKLYQDKHANTNVITGYGDDHVMIGKTRRGNVLVSAGRIVRRLGPAGRWRPRRTDGRGSQAQPNSAPRSLIVGTGRRQRFPSHRCCAGWSRRASASSSWTSPPPAAPTTSSWPKAARSCLGLLHER